MSGKDASTKYTTDNTAKFLPMGQDMDEEEKNKLKVDVNIQEQLKPIFDKMKSLMNVCEGKNCSSKEISHLLSMLDSPELKKHLQEFKKYLQLKEQHTGFNAFAPY